MAGTLYLVATPIGNLEDITHRALRILGESGLIACEDTRRTRRLLDHYEIRTPLVSYHEYNEAARSGELVDRLRRGGNVALVSDAGTPLISDPGYRLVAKAVAEGIRVEPVPGACASVTALSASGLPADSFHFAGFLPAKASRRRATLAGLRDIAATLVFYEAPHRILAALEDIEAILGPRPVVLAREVTKIHEEFLRGTAAEVARTLQARPTIKGEITLVVGRASAGGPDETPLDRAVQELVESGVSRMDAIKAVARRRGLAKREVYKALERGG